MAEHFFAVRCNHVNHRAPNEAVAERGASVFAFPTEAPAEGGRLGFVRTPNQECQVDEMGLWTRIPFGREFRIGKSNGFFESG